MRIAERATPLAAVFAALASLACCLPLAFLGAGAFAGIASWAGPYRPWFLALALVLLAAGFVQIYRGRKQCGRRSALSVALFWTSVAIVLLLLSFPQLIATLLAG